MTSIGTGYDLAASTYSPDGRIFQLEYTQKAIDNAGTLLAIKCTDGVVLAVEKARPSHLLRAGANKIVERVSVTCVMVGAGILADARHLVGRARDEATDYTRTLHEHIPCVQLAERIGLYVQQHTLYSSVRPFGTAMMVAGCDGNVPALFMVEPTGRVHGYKAMAVGKARQHARTELEKLLSRDDIDVEEGVKQAIKILVVARLEDPSARERQVELEVAYIKPEGVFEHVSLELINRISKQTRDSLNAAMEFEEI